MKREKKTSHKKTSRHYSNGRGEDGEWGRGWGELGQQGDFQSEPVNNQALGS